MASKDQSFRQHLDAMIKSARLWASVLGELQKGYREGKKAKDIDKVGGALLAFELLLDGLDGEEKIGQLVNLLRKLAYEVEKHSTRDALGYAQAGKPRERYVMWHVEDKEYQLQPDGPTERPAESVRRLARYRAMQVPVQGVQLDQLAPGDKKS